MPRLHILAGLVLAAVLAACTSAVEPVLGTPESIEFPGSGHVTGPRFSTGPDGDLTLSWMKRAEHGTTLRYSTILAGTFGHPNTVVVDPGMFVNWADLPSVMHVANGHWIAHWLRYSADKTYSYDVVVSQSFDGGDTWTDALAAHTDGTPTEHGFVSMHRGPDGVALLWLDGRATGGERGDDPLETSMTLRSAVISADNERRHEQLVDDSVCDCCQTDVAVSRSGPVAVYRNRTADEVRDIYVTRFVDNRWQPGVPLHDDGWVIPGCPVNGPSIVARNDFVAVAWFTAANNEPAVRVVTSGDGGKTFGKPVTVASGRIAGYTGLALLNDDAVAVSWVGRSASGNNSLHVRRLAEGGDPGPVLTVGETSQLRVFPQLGYQDGYLYLAWTDETDSERHMKAVRIPVAPS